MYTGIGTIKMFKSVASSFEIPQLLSVTIAVFKDISPSVISDIVLESVSGQPVLTNQMAAQLFLRRHYIICPELSFRRPSILHCFCSWHFSSTVHLRQVSSSLHSGHILHRGALRFQETAGPWNGHLYSPPSRGASPGFQA